MTIDTTHPMPAAASLCGSRGAAPWEGAAGHVEYESRGAVLAFGDAERSRQFAQALGGELRVVVVASWPGGDFPAPSSTVVVPGRVREVTGYLGRFRARVEGPEGLLDLGPLSPNRDGCFDVVVDLGPRPCVGTELLPLGYLDAGPGAEALERAATQARQWVGRFRKPRYFVFYRERCVHRRRGVAGCDRCLSVCPAGAIQARGETVAVDEHLCQGCGGCTAVCPTAAITYDAPPLARTLDRLWAALRTSRAGRGAAPRVVLHETATDTRLRPDHDDQNVEPVLPFSVPALAALGPEVWLGCLARGAGSVELVPAADAPATTRALLSVGLSQGRALLGALGLPPGLLRLAGEPQTDLSSSTLPTMREPFVTEDRTNRRSLLFSSLAALGGQALTGEVPLPVGVPYGGVEVDGSACTLCRACVNLCPTGALSAGLAERPGLVFVEELCVQCGLCREGCPEQAIRLVPRLLLDKAERERSRTLHVARDLARCVRCGAPYASRALLDAALSRVQASKTLRGEAQGLLELCPACRVEATMLSEFRPARPTPGRGRE